MDIAGHMLWVAAVAALPAVRERLSPREAAAAITLAGLPDVLQLLPIVAAAVAGAAPWHAVAAFALALPGQEPTLPAAVAAASHHLHCVAHSAPAAALVTLLSWRVLGRPWLPLLGWWSHVAIDVFTHSADFYPSPVLYPFSDATFDGIAWNRPGFLAAHYAALAAFALWVVHRRRRARTGASAMR